MFDKELFFSLCEKYNVELSETADRPMIRNGEEVHSITDEDINRVFAPDQTYFPYLNNKINADSISMTYSYQEDFAIAC